METASRAPRPRREGFVRLRASTSEAARWQAAADAAGQPSLSAWLRSLADEAAATGRTGREVAEAVAALRADLGRGLGNNLNQVAHRLNGGGAVAQDELVDMARDLAVMRRTLERALRSVRPPRVPVP